MAKSFWSVTLYDEHFNLVLQRSRPLLLRRQGAGPDLRQGRLAGDLHPAGHSPQVDKAANWLPSPKGKDFNLFLRTYFPGPTLLDQSYAAPAVVKVAN